LWFYNFETSQREHNKLDCQFFFLLKFHYLFYVSLFKTWCKLMMFQKSFCMFQTIMHNGFFFFQTYFFLSSVHHSFSKLERILTLIIFFKKHFKLLNFILKRIWTYLFQICFWFESYEFWKGVFNESYSILCYLKHGYIVYKQYKLILWIYILYIQHTNVNWLSKSWFLAMNGRIYINMRFKLFCESYLHSNLFWLHFTFIGFKGFLAARSFEMKWWCTRGKF